MMVRIASDKALPFEPLVPNAETIEAMKAARRGETTTVASPEALLASLDADDKKRARPRRPLAPSPSRSMKIPPGRPT
jgi:hypothetical protein